MALLIQWMELGQTLGDGEGQEDLVCCSPWDHEESHMSETEQQQVVTIGLIVQLRTMKCHGYSIGRYQKHTLPILSQIGFEP